MQHRALEIAKAVLRRRGSPDGARDHDDLLNSVWHEIHQQPHAELAGVANTEELLDRLATLLFDRWIAHRRKAVREKRGGGRVHPTSQLTDAGGTPLRADAFTDDAKNLDAEVARLLDDLFPAAPEDRLITEQLLAGNNQEEIAAQLGVSRHAIGRRVRHRIGPVVEKLLKEEEARP